jgi:hypothetical protein
VVALMAALLLLVSACGYVCVVASKKRAKRMPDSSESLHNILLVEERQSPESLRA